MRLDKVLRLDVFMMFIGIFLLIFISLQVSAKTIIVSKDGNGDYETIQEAIDAADEDDLIRVWEGMYNEDITVDKQLDIEGNSSEDTIVIAPEGEHAATITSDWCSITSMGIRDADDGIRIEADNNSITDCNVSSNENGIHLVDAENTTITDCLIMANEKYGIFLEDSHGNNISHCSVLGNGEDGLYLDPSHENSFYMGDINDNGGYGVHISASDSFSLVSSNVNENAWDGIYGETCSDTEIRDVAVMGSGWYGLNMEGPDGLLLYDCAFSDSDVGGAQFFDASDLEVIDCAFSRNGETGFAVYQFSNAVMEDIEFNENIVYGCFIFGGEHLDISNIAASYNGEDGVYLEEISDMWLVDAQLSYNDANGGFLNDCAGVEIDDVAANENGQVGINVLNAIDIIIQRIEANENGEDGARIDSSEDVEIKDSEFNLNDGSGVLIISSELVDIEDIVTKANKEHGLELKSIVDALIEELTSDENEGSGINIEDSIDITLIRIHTLLNRNYGVFVDNVTLLEILNAYLLQSAFGIRVQDSDSPTIEDSEVSDNTEDGILIFDTPGSTLRNITVRNNTKNGTNFIRSDNGTISDSNISANGKNGINITDSINLTMKFLNLLYNNESGIFADNCSRLKLIFMYMAYARLVGMILKNCDNATVEDTNITDSEQDGVHIQDCTGYHFHNVLTDSNGWRGFFIERSKDGTIKDSTILDSEQDGAHVQDCTGYNFHNVLTSNNGWRGFLLEGSSDGSLEDCTSRNNGDIGIDGADLSDITVSGALIESNVADGIVLRSAQDVSVSNGNIQDNGGDGIRITYAEDIDLSKLKFKDNGKNEIDVMGSTLVAAKEVELLSNWKLAHSDDLIHLEDSDMEIHDSTIKAKPWGFEKPPIFIHADDECEYVVVERTTFECEEVGELSLEIGNGATLRGVNKAPADPPGNRNIGKYLEIVNLSAFSWLKVIFNYGDIDLSGVNETNLVPFLHNLMEWVRIPDFRQDIYRMAMELNLTDIGFLGLFDNGSKDLPVENEDTGKKYETIQEALDDDETLDGHTITCQPGVYKGTIYIYKAVTLKGNGDDTVIDAEGSGPAVLVNRSGFKIMNFKLTNGSLGIAIYNVKNVIITGCLISDNSGLGMHVDNCEDIEITDNRITGNGRDGKLVTNSEHILVEDNEVQDNGECDDGGNRCVRGNGPGAEENCGNGSAFWNCINVTIRMLLARRNALAGISLMNCQMVTLEDLEASENERGLLMDGVTDFEVIRAITSSNTMEGICAKADTSRGVWKVPECNYNVLGGLSFKDCNNQVVEGGVFNYNGGPGIIINSCQIITLKDLESNENDEDGVFIVQSADTVFDGITVGLNRNNGISSEGNNGLSLYEMYAYQNDGFQVESISDPDITLQDSTFKCVYSGRRGTNSFKGSVYQDYRGTYECTPPEEDVAPPVYVHIDGWCPKAEGELVLFKSYPTTFSFTAGGGINLSGVQQAPPDPKGMGNISHYINAVNLTQDSWLNITFHYNDTDLGNIDETTLKLYRFDGTAWHLLPDSVVDVTGNTVYGNITEFSIIAPFAEMLEEKDEDDDGNGFCGFLMSFITVGFTMVFVAFRRRE